MVTIVEKVDVVKGHVIRDEAALEYFADLGASFVLLYPRSKHPIEENWNKKPRSLAAARSHVQQAGGGVAVLTGEPSRGLIFLDLDADFAKFGAQFPWVVDTPTVAARGVTDRARPLIRIVDELPPNRIYVPESGRPPTAEVLSTGRKGVIPPSYNPDAQAYYELRNAHRPVLEMSLNKLERVWKAWTGVDLRKESPRPKASAQGPPRSFREGVNLVTQVKAAWSSALMVFEHHGIAGEIKRISRNPKHMWRLGRNGYIVAGDETHPDHAPLWYDFSQQIGGDQIDAWGYCRHGAAWDRNNKALFIEVLNEMAQAAGIDPDSD